MNAKLKIFNIQKFCVHDGPGIRTTVFLKGCPLRCLWCHNPEGLGFSPELLFNPEKCTGCGRCLKACPHGALSWLPQDGKIKQDRELCRGCGNCADACISGAREISGYEIGVGDLIREIEKDRVFYEQSGGGVTFSGGEALCQADAVAEAAKVCKSRGIHTVVDTCGQVPFAAFEQVMDYVDLFLYDIKHMDPALHRQYMGQDNQRILENLSRLSAAGARIFLRLPLVEGINADDRNIAELVSYIRGLHIVQVNLLPYHNTGNSKHQRLGNLPPSGLAAPSEQRLEAIRGLFAEQGLPVYIGG